MYECLLYLPCEKILFFLFSLSFFCIALSPYITMQKCDSILYAIYSLFLYRFLTLSIFSLLFATLTTIQKYEKQQVAVALSASGISSWQIMRKGFYFSIFLCICSLLVNEFLLKGSLKYLGKNKPLSKNQKDLCVLSIDNNTVFFNSDGKDFTIIDDSANITYSKYAARKDDLISLSYVDSFHKNNHIYEITGSQKQLDITLNPSHIFAKSSLQNSDSISTFYQAEKNFHSIYDIDKAKIDAIFSYRILTPFLHLFSFSFATFIGFHYYFRKRFFITLSTSLLLFLTTYYYMESSYILSYASSIHLYYFLIPAILVPCFTLSYCYVKKV